MLTADQVGETYKPTEDYTVRFDPQDYIIVEAGALWHTAGARFQHPNVVASCTRVFECKHYYASGRKKWTSHPGVEFYFVIPKSRIELVPEKGYSYVPVIIGGLKTSFNVSGGTGGNGWTDYVGRKVATKIGYGLRDLRKFADVALSVDECRATGRAFDLNVYTRERGWFAEAAARNTPLQAGFTVVQAAGWSCDGYSGPLTVESKPAKRHYYVCRMPGGGYVRMRYDAINWAETRKANGLNVSEPFAWNKIGQVVEAAD